MMKDSVSNKTTSILDFRYVAKIRSLQKEIEKVIKGKSETVKLSVVTLIARGNLLIEDVPGIGKTTLSNALARSLNLSFQRIQFTADLLPSDVIGLSVYNQRTEEFEFKPGPIFANIVLADEINRATPKTQSALLEAMAERQVTVDGISRPLPEPFMVVATQNPTEHHGTYPLPESQLDRFTLRLHIGYPNREEEKQILRDREKGDPLDFVHPVMDKEEILHLQNLASQVHVDDLLVEYLLQIVEQTRKNDQVEIGISPRGSLSLFHTAQALALVEGRDFCIADDIKRLVLPCFAHRLIINSRQSNRTREAERILKEILSKTKVPV
jgi:MoxR-like ATPase